ncbi:MAG: hypothetical protein RL540_1760, partial [Actinomycetota bacterium]
MPSKSKPSESEKVQPELTASEPVSGGALVRVDREKESASERSKRFERDALQYM